MKAVLEILTIQLTILIMIAIGFAVTKAGFFSAKTRADLTDLSINIILPCSILSAFNRTATPDLLRQSAIVLIVAFGLQLLAFILNLFVYKKIPDNRSAIMKHGMISNNASFMGFPIIGAVFGPTGVLFGSIFLIPMRILMWTSGLSLFTEAGGKQKLKMLLSHPCIWSVFVGFAYMFVPFELPQFIWNAITYIGDCARVLPMLIVGSILSGIKLKDMLDLQCYFYSFFRLIAIPAVLFVVLMLLKVDELVRNVAVLSSAMPTAITTVMLADKYDKDAAFASKLVVVSTILSIATLPVLTLFLK